MAYSPDNKNYLKKDWSGVVTANDLAIQNQPWSLGQHQGATPEQLAQQEREQWFRDRGLDPNQYYGEQIEAQAPQPGFNPAGGKVNQGKPIKQQTIGSDGRTAAEFAAQQKANKDFEQQNERTIDRKALLANPHTAIPLLPNKNAPIVPTTPSVPGMPTGAPVRFDNGPIENVVPQGQRQEIFPGLQNAPRPAPGVLPNYNSGAARGGSINDVLKQYQTGGATLPMSPIGQPNVQPSPLTQLQPQQGLPTPGSAPTGAPSPSFGNAAKLLQLPAYLRRGMGGIRTY